MVAKVKREDIVEHLSNKGIDFNPGAPYNDLFALYKEYAPPQKEKPAEPALDPVNTATPADVVIGRETGFEHRQRQINETLAKNMEVLTSTVKSLRDEIQGLTVGGDTNEYRQLANREDIQFATDSKKNIDPRVVRIVESVLGVDFGVELNTFEDRPGYLFTVIVPERLSDVSTKQRPVKDPEGGYKTDKDGNTMYESYVPKDRRSRAIGSAQSYDAIKDHCERVRSYIVSYYEKTKRPLPEFKLK